LEGASSQPDVSAAELLEKVLSQLPDPVLDAFEGGGTAGIPRGGQSDHDRGHAMATAKTKAKMKAKADSATKAKRATKVKTKAKSSEVRLSRAKPFAVTLRARSAPQAEIAEEELQQQSPELPNGKIFSKAVGSLVPKAVCLRRRCSLGGA